MRYACMTGRKELDMNIEERKKITIIGHKNPDTDSICSAIAYARLKNAIAANAGNVITGGDSTGNDDSVSGECYEAKRAGHLNEETQFVLDYFKVKKPEYIKDVRTQVQDVEIRRVPGVDRNISLKQAWNMMRKDNLYTLPITSEDKLEGLITIGDIAESYMDVYDSNILAAANTSCSNIVDTLDGDLLVGSMSTVFDKGKVLIAAASPDLMENYIEPGDIVILGNRYESQLSAIEMDAGCIVVCEGAEVALTISKLAGEHDCMIITTPHDTYTAARLINQSMPISYFMRTTGLVTFNTRDFIADIQDVMAKLRYRDFAVLDSNTGNYVGLISRRTLMKANKKKLILVDHNEKSQAVYGIEDAEILEIIDHHRLGTIETMNPVFFRNQPLGCTATIIYQMYNEHGLKPDATTAGLLCAAIISDTLMYRSPTCTEPDRKAASELAAIAGIDIETFAHAMFKAGSNLMSKTTKEICYQDFKKFKIDDVMIGIGQINSVNGSEFDELKGRVISELPEVMKDNNLQMVFFMLTNIMKESSEIVFAGRNAGELLKDAFNAEPGETSVMLDGIVSRKKQFLPTIIEAMEAQNV